MPNLGARNGTTVRGSGDVLRGTSTASAAIDVAVETDADVAGATGIAAWSRIRAEIRTRVSITAVLRDITRRRLVVTEPGGGAELGELTRAEYGSLSRELNRPSEFTATLKADDPDAALVVGPGTELRELKVYAGELLLHWGPIVRPAMRAEATSKDIALSSKSAEWHFTRRTIGKAERENLLTNPDFEDGLTGWTVLRHASSSEPELAFILQGPSATAFAAITGTLAPPVSGLRALRLVEANVLSSERPFVFQDVEVTTGEVEEVFTFTAWLRVQEAGYNQANPRDTGLLLGVLPEDYRDLNYPGYGSPLPPGGFSNMFWAARELDFFALDFAKIGTPPTFDVWLPYEASVRVPPGQTVTVQARIEGPAGTLFADRCALVRSEGLHFIDEDQTSGIAAGLVEHLQDGALGKSDVNISAKCAPSGVTRTRSYYYSEHPDGWQALSEFHGYRDGFDYGMTYTPTERRYTTYYPEKGRRVGVGLTFPGNIASFAYSFDGEAATSSVILLGDGRGDGREEASAIDGTAFGGLTLEEVLSAPEGTPVVGLDELAEEELAAALEPVVLAVRTVFLSRGVKSGDGLDAGILLGRLTEGDFVDVQVRSGPLDFADVYRVVRWTLTPEDRLDLVLNRRSPR